MTFKRINGDTICCILSQEDMQDYGVELEDFLMNKDKIQDLLHEIVEMAGEELGFDVKKGMLSLQIMPLPDNGISIMFSERGQMDVMDIVNQMKRALGDLQEAAKTKEAAKTEKTHKSGKSSKHTKSAKEQAAGISDLRIYEFNSLDKVAAFCAFIPTKCKIVSQLYKDSKRDAYMLVFEKSKLSVKEFAGVCSKAAEFGKFVSDSPVRAAHMEEHFEHIIEGKAVKVMRRFAKGK